MIREFFTLKRRGILGLNRRNRDYILKYNHRDGIILVDDKILTKQKALAHNICVPPLYNVMEFEGEKDHLIHALKNHTDFVIKPARGAGGKGIIIIADVTHDKFRKMNGSLLSEDDLRVHLSRILSGAFSLGGNHDKVLIEYRVKSHPIFDKISFRGVPDLRIIVFKGYPVMAMGRFPTFYSDGKANLHQGAIGVAINIATGVTHNGVLKQEYIHEHPDTLFPISGLQIPEWDKLLEIASQCYELTDLGYIGVDLVIDEKLGPMMLEINARPGLNIQIANQDGLWRRLKLLQPHVDGKVLSPAERIGVSKGYFG